MRATVSLIPLTALACASLAVVGCGSSGSGASADTSAPARAAAAADAPTVCPNRLSTSERLVVRNTLDVPVTINNGSHELCRWFSESGNPTTYNGRVIPAGAQLTMGLQMTALSGTWRMAIGAADRTVGSTTTVMAPYYAGSRNGNVSPRDAFLRFKILTGEMVAKVGIGSLKAGTSAAREVELVGSQFDRRSALTMTIGYVK